MTILGREYMRETKIDFIRHTRLRDVDGSFCYGASDLDVAESFLEEAESVRRALEGRTYDATFTSPLRRARKLAAFCGYETATIDPRLAERNFGEWEMRPWDELYSEIRRQPDLLLLEERNPELVTPPGGESIDEMRHRVTDLVEEVCLHPEWERVAFFCHGGVINMGRWIKGVIDFSDLFIDIPHYGSITTLSFTPDELAHNE